MTITDKTYTMSQASDVAGIATSDVTVYLNNNPATIEVRNVENDSDYQAIDIDILWKFHFKKDTEREISIEIKGDRYFHTGNYFFETLSNEQKNTPGCFLYSEADYLFYYFVKRELHIIPLKRARAWFLGRMQEFEERRTTTPLGKGHYYNTVGRLVPRTLLCSEMKVKVVPFSEMK